MKIIFMGTPLPAAACLEELLKSGNEIVGVVTQPDRPKGRGLKLVPSPVKEMALKYDLPLQQPEKIKNAPVFVSLLRSLKPDLIVVVAYGKILPKEILDLPKHGCINLHASLLPKYRGAAPIQWAILNGEKETGVTVMRLNEGLDTGDIISQEKVKISSHDTSATLSEKLFKAGPKLLTETVNAISKGKVKLKPQDNNKATYAALLTKESGLIDWKKDSSNILNRIRAMDPWPGAYTFRRGELLKIWKAQIVAGTGLAGQIIALEKSQGFVVCTKNSALLVTEVQPAGRKRMSAKDFLQGYHLKINETLPN